VIDRAAADLAAINVEIFRGRVSRNSTPCRLRERELELIVALVSLHAPLPRDTLLEHLWPGVGRERAAPTLRTTVHRLRRCIGEHTTIVHEGGYRLGDHVRVDVRDAEETVRASRVLPDAEGPRREHFERLFRSVDVDLPYVYDTWTWFGKVKPRLVELRRACGLLLIDVDLQALHFSAAIEVAERLLTFDQLDTSVVAIIARAYIEGGKPLEAKRRVRHHAKFLAQEYGSKLPLGVLRLVGEDDFYDSASSS
jgi:DNA-binding SARP family transcriptional activator